MNYFHYHSDLKLQRLNYGNDGYDMVFERIGLGEAKEEKAE